jgi:GNAT superfamily N-acetyltransferase
MTSMTIREVRQEHDADGIVALIRASSPTAVITPESWRHRTATVPERAQLKGWVAEDGGLTVGYVHAFLNFFTEGSTTAYVLLDVHTSHRRRGLGSQLYDLAVAHAREQGATSVLTTFDENEAGIAFARGRGFREVRAETNSSVDPRTVDERPSPEIDLRPVAEADPVLVYTVDMEATRDIPATEPMNVMPYEDWRQHVLEHPLFAPEGSFVAMVDGVAAAVSLILVDNNGRATSMFTGTVREHRGRGFALAVKLASIEWASDHGVTRLFTTNDERNAPMLAINRRLGFEPAGRRVEYLREEEPVIPPPPA